MSDFRTNKSCTRACAESWELQLTTTVHKYKTWADPLLNQSVHGCEKRAGMYDLFIKLVVMTPDSSKSRMLY